MLLHQRPAGVFSDDGAGGRKLPELGGATMNHEWGQMKRAILFRRMARRILHLRGEEGGAPLVEFAIVLPVLLMLIMGMCWFGLLFLDYFQLTNGSDAAARAVAVYRGITASSTADPCATAAAAFFNAAGQLNQSNLTVTMTITPNGESALPAETLTPTATCQGTSLGSQGGGTIQVVATYTAPTPIIEWATKSITVTASTTERIE